MLNKICFNSNSTIGLEIFNFVIDSSISPETFYNPLEQSLIKEFVSKKFKNINELEENKKKAVWDDLNELSFWELSQYNCNEINDIDIPAYTWIFDNIQKRIVYTAFSLEDEMRRKDGKYKLIIKKESTPKAPDKGWACIYLPCRESHR